MGRPADIMGLWAATDERRSRRGVSSPLGPECCSGRCGYFARGPVRALDQAPATFLLPQNLGYRPKSARFLTWILPVGRSQHLLPDCATKDYGLLPPVKRFTPAGQLVGRPRVHVGVKMQDEAAGSQQLR